MPYLGWAMYAGQEIISNSRAAAYAKGVSVMCSCDTLPEALGDEPYTTPEDDRAPWFDTSEPHSRDFWGVLGLEIGGASQSTLSHNMTDLIGDGAVPDAGRRASREVEFKVMLLARTEAALSYGIRWLAAALQGSACDTGCAGDRLCLLAGCPEPPPTGHETDPCLPGTDGDDDRKRRDRDRSNNTSDRAGNGHTDPGAPNRRRDPDPPPAPKPPQPEPKPAPKAAAEPDEWPPPPDPGPAPRGGQPGPPDPAVMRTVLLVGKQLGVNDKVMLAAFETGLVESQMTNLNWGDRDSVGVFQQRPSAGWGTPEQCMNVNHAAKKFFAQAILVDQDNPRLTPGLLAQEVQKSAYPDKYDKKEGEARGLIRETGAAIRDEHKPKPPPKPDPAPKPPPEPTPTPQPDKPQPKPDQPEPDTPTPPPEPEPEPWDAYDAATPLVHSLYDVVLLEFADDEERARINGAWTATMTFTLAAGRPAWYGEPVTLVDSRAPKTTRFPSAREVVDNYRIDRNADCPDDEDPLAASPYLARGGPWGDASFPGINPADPTWRDPSYPVAPFTARRSLYDSPGDITPTAFSRVPIITVNTGRSDMHRITLRFYANPRGKDITPRLDPCDACNEITLPWAPAHTRVTLDGRTHQVEARDRYGRTMHSDITLYGPLGAVLEWPEFECGIPMIVEVIAQDGTVAPDAWWRIQWSAKTDAV